MTRWTSIEDSKELMCMSRCQRCPKSPSVILMLPKTMIIQGKAHPEVGFVPLCRPAVMVSYLIAALAALLSGLAYAEFAVDLPVSGGATTCILLTFGELASW